MTGKRWVAVPWHTKVLLWTVLLPFSLVYIAFGILLYPITLAQKPMPQVIRFRNGR